MHCEKALIKHIACIDFLNNDHKVESHFILYSGLGGYDKISQGFLLKKSDDKSKLNKVDKFLRVYGYFMGFILHRIANI